MRSSLVFYHMNHFNYGWNSEYNYGAQLSLNYGETNDMHAYGESFDLPFAPTYNPKFSWSQTQSLMNQGDEFNMPNQGHGQLDLSYPIQQEMSPSLKDTLQ